MRPNLFLLGITLILLLFFSSCNYTKNLYQNEYALVKNTVKIEDIKGIQYDDLIDLVRPIPNKKFMGIFPIKVSLWANHQPRFDSITGRTKDSKFNQWLRRIGEPPILLDTGDMQRSITQIDLAMFKRGYFDATTRAEVQFLRKQKARVNYFVSPNQPYYIRSINYQIDIPEYKRIVMTDTANALVKKGAIYNEEELVAERNRIVSKIKDQGFFYVTPNIITFLVDTNNAFTYLNAQHQPTVALTIRISLDDVNDEVFISKHKNRYRFNNVLIYTNSDLNFDRSLQLDTIPFLDFRNKSDSTLYEFVTVKIIKRGTNRVRLVKDFTSRTIAGAIWMKRGDMFTQTAYDRTYRKLRALNNNFTTINISYSEEEVVWDSINNIGALNTIVRLTRARQHDVEANFELRTDRTGLSLAYTNKNIFRGAEYFKIGGFGNVYYYRWLNALINKESMPTDAVYGEIGGEVLFRFPRLLMLPKYQNINFWGYSTEIKFTASYTQFLSRLNLQLAYIYNWSPVRNLTHSISPVELATLHSSRDTVEVAKYPVSYQRKFDSFFLPSARYALNYWLPGKRDHIFRVNFSFESVGMLLYGVNSIVDKNNMWSIFNDFKYGVYGKFDLNLAYTKIINRDNAFATRFVFGMAMPLRKGTVIPFERSFFAGGSNSMRGWTFRQLGPGGYYSEKPFMDRVGDMRLELNLEYRGTIYKAFKYGVFSDIGNIWLLSKYEDMLNAEFNFSTFYKQIAICVGVGLRLDFSFFIIRLDYGLPIYNPSMPIDNYWISKNWRNYNWSAMQGMQFGIGYAF